MEDVVRAGGHVGVIAEEASPEAITGVDVLSGRGASTPTQVADDVIQPRVIDVVAQRRAVDPAFRWRRTRGAGLPRRNDGTAIGAEVHMAVWRHRGRRENVLDRAC